MRGWGVLLEVTRRGWLLGCVLSACTSAEPPPGLRTAEREPAILEPAATPAPEAVPEPTREVPSIGETRVRWRWHEELNPRLATSFSGVGVGDRAWDDRVGDPRLVTVELLPNRDVLVALRPAPEHDEDEVLPAPRWQQALPGPAAGDPVVQLRTSEGPSITVAYFTADGYRVFFLDDQGTRRGGLHLRCSPMPCSPRAELQLGTDASDPEHVVVYVRDVEASFIDELSLTEHLGRRGIPAALRRVTFELPDALPGRWLGDPFEAEHGSYRVLHRSGRLELHSFDDRRPTRTRWVTVLEQERPAWLSHAAVLELPERIFVLCYGTSVSGSSVYVLDHVDGRLLDQVSPGDIGLIGHSRYHNQVSIGRHRTGAVVVLGEESGGRYLGALDPSTGAPLGHVIWRP